ncbi:MAG: hypothetical protein K9I74_07970 [Bacteroidales bacterium]|nr:hypothetical protein [Bacteroidales bacterium]
MKLSNKIKKQAAEIAEKHGFREIWVNDMNEFFSLKSNAANSVEGDSKRYAEVPLGGVAQEEVKSADELIKEVEASEDIDALEKVIEVEKKEKNRKTVIEAAEKKLESLIKNDE